MRLLSRYAVPLARSARGSGYRWQLLLYALQSPVNEGRKRAGEGFFVILQWRRLHAHHNGRMPRTYDADASARRNWNIRHGLPRRARDANGACCVWTATFFVLEPPWRNLSLHEPRGAPRH